MKNFFRSIVIRGLALVLALVAGVSLAAAQKLPAGVVDRGPLAAATRVHATLYLAPEATRTSALVQFLNDVQTPGAATFQQWVSATDFATRFGATDAQIARVRAFAENNSLKIESVTGLRVRLTGSAGAIEMAFAPGLHRVTLAEKDYVAATTSAGIPANLAADVTLIGGMDTVPVTNALAITTDGTAVAGKHGALEDLADTVEANTARILTLTGTTCATDFTDDTRTAMQSVLREAAAQGQSVLALSGCTTTSAVSFPAVLPEVTSVVLAPANETGVAASARPWWQLAPGLPADALRHEPDLQTGDLNALAATFTGILAEMPSGSRLGNLNAALYEIAPMKGLYTQPDATSTGIVGNWESATGLGLVDLQKLAQWFPHGSASTYITVTTTPSYANHGGTITFAAAVKDISGSGTAPPSGSVSFSTDAGLYLGTGTLSPNGTVSANTSVSSNQTPTGGFNVVATYSGDSFYATNKNQTYYTVGPEEGILAATVAGTVPLGGTIQVTITDTSPEGVGTPNVTGYVIPQGIANPATYSVLLTGSNGVASGSVSIPATQAGSLTLFVGCTSTDPSFTCYNAINVTATVSKATPTMTLSVVPNPPVTGTNTAFTAQLTGLTGQALPTGVIIFFDNGVNIGQNGVDATGKSVYTANGLSASTAHSFSATYYGDSNYVGASASPAASGSFATTTAVTINPNPPVVGSTTTLTAKISNTGYTGTAAIGGTATFVIDGSTAGSGAVNGGVATYTTTGLSGTSTHTIQALYSGDPNFASSSSPIVTTPSSVGTATTTAVTVNPNPPVLGTATTITATIAHATGTNNPGGTAQIYIDGTLAATASLVNGVATYTSATISGATTHTFYAVYLGDGTYAGSTSPTVTSLTTGAKVITTTTLSVTPNPPTGPSTTLVATIAPVAYSGTTIPTGTVTFYDGATVLSQQAVLGNSTAIYAATISGTVSHAFSAIYAGDTTFATSTSTTVNTVGNPVTTTTAITVSPNPPVLGSTTTLTAKVSQGTGGGTALPSGTLTFYMDGVALTPAATVLSGNASYTSTTLSGATAHSFTGVYSGDATFGTSTSPAVTTPGTKLASAVTLAINPTAPVSGSTTTLTATVASGVTTSKTVPTGTVTFLQDGVALTTTAAVSATGVATYSSTTLNGATTHQYSAVYSGDSLYATGTSNTVSTVETGVNTTSFTLTVNPTPPVSGKTTTLTAKLVASGSGVTAAPTGTVTFLQDGVALSAAMPLSSTGTTSTAAYTSTTLSGTATHSYTASYSGDAVFAASTSPVVATPAASTGSISSVTTLVGSANAVAINGTVTYTATVTSGTASSTTVPTGTVTLTNAAGVVLGSGLLNASGVATIAYTPTASGVMVITATYGGDTVYASDASTPVTLTVGATTLPSGTLSLQLTPTSIAYGGTVTANVAVTGATSDGVGPTGSVSLAVTSTVGAAAIGSYAVALTPVSATLSNGSVQITGGTPGSYTVTATCATTNIKCSATAALGFIVTKGTDSITVTGSPNPPVAGQSEVLTATIAPTYGGTGTFTGYVTFYVNGVAIGSSPVNGNVATYTTTLPSSVSNTIYATYSGDANWLPSTSSQISLAVPPTPTSSVLSTSTTTALQGSNVIFTMTVTAIPTSPYVLQSNPTGSVAFYDTLNGVQVKIGTANLTAAGQFTSVAQFTTTGLQTGTHTILGVYTGATAYSSSTAGTVTVDITDYSVAFSPSSATVTKGSTLTALATVAAINGFSGQVVLGCVPPSGTATTCSFNPAIISSSGISTLTITTTKSSTGAVKYPGAVEEVALAVLLTALLLPGVRRKKPVLFATLAAVLMLGSVGCTTVNGLSTVTSGSGSGSGSGGSGSTTGTPSGTLTFAITASGTDGRTTNKHTYQYLLTIQ